MNEKENFEVMAFAISKNYKETVSTLLKANYKVYLEHFFSIVDSYNYDNKLTMSILKKLDKDDLSFFINYREDNTLDSGEINSTFDNLGIRKTRRFVSSSLSYKENIAFMLDKFNYIEPDNFKKIISGLYEKNFPVSLSKNILKNVLKVTNESYNNDFKSEELDDCVKVVFEVFKKDIKKSIKDIKEEHLSTFVFDVYTSYQLAMNYSLSPENKNVNNLKATLDLFGDIVDAIEGSLKEKKINNKVTSAFCYEAIKHFKSLKLACSRRLFSIDNDDDKKDICCNIQSEKLDILFNKKRIGINGIWENIESIVETVLYDDVNFVSIFEIIEKNIGKDNKIFNGTKNNSISSIFLDGYNQKIEAELTKAKYIIEEGDPKLIKKTIKKFESYSKELKLIKDYMKDKFDIFIDVNYIENSITFNDKFKNSKEFIEAAYKDFKPTEAKNNFKI